MLQPARNDLRKLKGDRSGAVAIEYALIVLLIVIVLVASIFSIGTSVSGYFFAVATSL